MNTTAKVRSLCIISLILLSVGDIHQVHAQRKKHASDKKITITSVPAQEFNAKQPQTTTSTQALNSQSISLAAISPALPSKPPKKLSGSKRYYKRRFGSVKEKKKILRDMSLQELETTKNTLVAENNKEIAVKYVERMLKLSKNVNQIAKLMIELADLFFDIGKLEKAELVYAQFTLLYPGNENIEYASYRAILCAFYSSLDAERDQSKTHDAINRADTFLEREDIFTIYSNEVKKIRTQCYHKIIDSEMSICSFYIHRGSLQAAQLRLDDVRKEWLLKAPDIETQLVTLQTEIDIKKQIARGDISSKEGSHKLKEFAKSTKVASKPSKSIWKNRF